MGRTVRWTHEGIEYEADEKHREELMRRMGLRKESKAVVGSVAREAGEGEGEEDQELEGEERAEFRGCCALLNYLGLDRSDIQYATNQVCREMARPTVRTKAKVKRAVRSLIGFSSWANLRSS